MTFLGLSILTSASFYMIFDNFNVSVILMGYIGFHKLDHLCIAKSCKVCVNGFYLYPFWGVLHL